MFQIGKINLLSTLVWFFFSFFRCNLDLIKFFLISIVLVLDLASWLEYLMRFWMPERGSFTFVPPPPSTLCAPSYRARAITWYKIMARAFGGCKQYVPTKPGGGHKRKRSQKGINFIGELSCLFFLIFAVLSDFWCGIILNLVGRLSERTTQVEVQTQTCFWSDFPDRNYLWSEFPDGNSPWSDFPDPSDLWSDFPDTESLWPDFSDRRCSDQTIFRPWSRLKFRPLPRP